MKFTIKRFDNKTLRFNQIYQCDNERTAISKMSEWIELFGGNYIVTDSVQRIDIFLGENDN